MEEETGMQESSVLRESTETDTRGDLNAVEGRRGPTWRGWVFSILAAIILSVTATLLLGGSGAFRSESAIGQPMGHSGSGAGSGCCPPAAARK